MDAHGSALAYASSVDSALPANVGGYRVVRLLADSGSTRVVELEPPQGRGRLAAKVATNRVAAEQLAREFRVLERIEHPGVLRAHGLVRTDSGAPALVLDFVDGTAAQSRVKAMARPGWAARTREAARITLHVAEALVHVHARGLVHRDIKGTNVLVRDDGHVWLLDFGIAAELSGEGTDFGLFVGTVPCAAPEQVAGGILSEATDTFGLGGLFYRMLVARRPWEASTPEGLMSAHRAGQPPAPHALVPSVPRALSDICMRMIAQDPNARPHLTEVCGWLAHIDAQLARYIANDPHRGLPPPMANLPDLGPRDTDSA